VSASPRSLSDDQALPVAEQLRARGLKSAGIFRNGKVMDVALIAKRLRLDIVQLHGQEDASYIGALRNLLREPIEIWAASGVGRGPPRPREGADRTLFDTQVGGRSGGTGKTFDWNQIDPRVRSSSILAGGLNPANARAARRTGAWALDVASGVEAAPGRKDKTKMTSFMNALRAPARTEAASCA
jgi:indole-3-glycerol phosphate synthase/phosphoribosylanthranilate isomerase